MTTMAIGITVRRSWLDPLLTSYRPGASPATPESVAPISVATAVACVLIAGTASSAGVLSGSPAFSPTEYSTVSPSGLMYWAVAR